jgi:SAM-dependent methyltransferase
MMQGAAAVEAVKPIPVRRGTSALARAAFGARLVVDLQLLTCTRFLGPRLALLEGDVLDVGCGEMPFRGLLGPRARYIGIDVPAASDFGMTQNPDVLPFDGVTIPFSDARFAHVLCTEVLEHARAPEALVGEMMRVLKPGGTLVLTVPFAARVHHAPHDYHRFTRYGVAQLLAGFADVRVEERGDELAVIANKLIVLTRRLARLEARLLVRWPAVLLLAPASAFALAVAHLSLRFAWGSRMDPLGYGAEARKDTG